MTGSGAVLSAPHAARAPWWAYASLGLSMTLVGSYVGLSKLLVAVFPVFLLAWLRFGIAAVAMLGWLLAQFVWQSVEIIELRGEDAFV